VSTVCESRERSHAAQCIILSFRYSATAFIYAKYISVNKQPFIYFASLGSPAVGPVPDRSLYLLGFWTSDFGLPWTLEMLQSPCMLLRSCHVFCRKSLGYADQSRQKPSPAVGAPVSGDRAVDGQFSRLQIESGDRKNGTDMIFYLSLHLIPTGRMILHPSDWRVSIAKSAVTTTLYSSRPSRRPCRLSISR
jgi:hypothetical protein